MEELESYSFRFLLNFESLQSELFLGDFVADLEHLAERPLTDLTNALIIISDHGCGLLLQLPINILENICMIGFQFPQK